MKLERISEFCFYSTHEDSLHRPALGYIYDPNYPVMIDAGNSEKHVKEFLELLEEKQLPFPARLILTHSHWDHVFGMQYFLEGCNDCAYDVDFFKPAAITPNLDESKELDFNSRFQRISPANSSFMPYTIMKLNNLIEFIASQKTADDLLKNRELLKKAKCFVDTPITFGQLEVQLLLKKYYSAKLPKDTFISKFKDLTFQDLKDIENICREYVDFNSANNELINRLDEIKLVLPKHTFDDYLVYYSSRTVDIFNVDCPHCDNATLVFVHEDEIIYVGDALYAKLNICDDESFSKAITKFKDLIHFLGLLNFKYAIPSHHAPLTKDETIRLIYEQMAELTRQYTSQTRAPQI